MPQRSPQRIPSPPRKTLLEWIENDDGDTTGTTIPACSKQAQALHQRILLDPHGDGAHASELIQAPTGLRLAPLG